MRLLFLGDVVGRAGRHAVIAQLPTPRALQDRFCRRQRRERGRRFWHHGTILEDLLAAGADVVTLGNHAFDQRETLVFIARQDRLLRPINYPPGTPGKGAGLFKAANGADVLVINAMGLTYMPELACPFRAVDAELAACGLKQGADVVLIDFHAEATSEKQALGYFVDGRASCVVGTHTHTPTADERVLPGGTAFMCDVGMCGDYESVLGMDAAEPINRFLTKIPRGQFEPAMGPVTICGIAVEIDDETGLATRTKGLRLGGVLTPTEPLFWVD